MTTAASPADIASPQPTIQRSFTAPVGLNNSLKSPTASRNPVPDAAETLFAYHTAKIISFRASTGSNRQSLSSGATPSPNRTKFSGSSLVEERRRSLSGAAFAEKKRQSSYGAGNGETRRQSVYGAGWTEDSDEQAGTLPWKVASENNMASGPIYIYNVPGSATFVLCNSFLRAILPRSQCWCVDGNTIFAMRVRDDNYYRIELPNNNEEDKKAAEDFKQVLKRILQYETTACPFARGFYVELPERKEIIFKPWKPKHKSVNARDPASDDSDRREYSSREASSDEHDLGSEKEEEIFVQRQRRAVSRDAEVVVPLTPRDQADSSSPYVETVVSTFEDLKVSDQHPFTPTSQRLSPSPQVQDILEDHREEEDRSVASSLHNKVVCEDQAVAAPPSAISVAAEIPRAKEALSEENGLVNMVSSATPLAMPASITPIIDTQRNSPVPSGVDLSHTDDEPAQADSESHVIHEDRINAATKVESTSSRGTDDQSHGLRWMQFDDEEPTPTLTSTFSRSFTAPAGHDSGPDYRREVESQAHVTEIQPTISETQQGELEREAAAERSARDSDTLSHASSVESFHSTFPPFHRASDGGASPETYPELYSSRLRKHKHTDSQMTVRPNSSEGDSSTPEWLDLSPVTDTFSDANNGMEESPGTVPSASDVGVSSRQSSPASLLRKRLHKRRALSPMPPAAILYDPRDDSTGRHLTSLVLQTTYQYLLGPSAQLLSMMLTIASHVSGGAADADAPYDIRTGRKIPCAWDSEGSDAENSEDDGEHSTGSQRSGRQRDRRRGSEVDL